MSCGGCCADFITCCQINCCYGQPVSTSGPALDAAQCATIGTADTINALVSSGLGALTAIFGAKQQQQVATTAVKAQAQVTTAKSKMWMWGAVAAIAIVVFAFVARK